MFGPVSYNTYSHLNEKSYMIFGKSDEFMGQKDAKPSIRQRSSRKKVLTANVSTEEQKFGDPTNRYPN